MAVYIVDVLCQGEREVRLTSDTGVLRVRRYRSAWVERRAYYVMRPTPETLDEYDEVLDYWSLDEYDMSYGSEGLGELWEEGSDQAIGRVLPVMHQRVYRRLLERARTDDETPLAQHVDVDLDDDTAD